MAQPNERMDMISSAIRAQAEQQAREITDKANQLRDTQIAQRSEQVIGEMFTYTQQAVSDSKQKALNAISAAERQATQTLFVRREELSQQIFAQVRNRLLEYASGEEYRKQLAQEIASCHEGYDHTTTTLHLRTADMPLAGQLAALLPGCTILEDEQLALGGFVLENTAARILIDATLEYRLEQQKAWFREHCGLRVN